MGKQSKSPHAGPAAVRAFGLIHREGLIRQSLYAHLAVRVPKNVTIIRNQTITTNEGEDPLKLPLLLEENLLRNKIF